MTEAVLLEAEISPTGLDGSDPVYEVLVRTPSGLGTWMHGNLVISMLHGFERQVQDFLSTHGYDPEGRVRKEDGRYITEVWYGGTDNG